MQRPPPPAGMSKGKPSLPRTLKALSAHLDPCFSSTRDARRAGSELSLLLPYPRAGPGKAGRCLYVLLASSAPALPSQHWQHMREAGVSEGGPPGVG